MDIDATLRSANKYVREYLLYIIRFLALRSPEGPAEHLSDEDGQLIVHGTISLVVGIYLQQLVVAGIIPHGDLFGRLILVEVGFWAVLALSLNVLVFAFTRHGDLASAISVVLRVFPPALMISSLACAFAFALFFSLSTSSASTLSCERWFAVLADALTEWFLIALVLPRELHSATQSSPPLLAPQASLQTRAVTALLVIFTIAIHLTMFFAGNLKEALEKCL